MEMNVTRSQQATANILARLGATNDTLHANDCSIVTYAILTGTNYHTAANTLHAADPTWTPGTAAGFDPYKLAAAIRNARSGAVGRLTPQQKAKSLAGYLAGRPGWTGCLVLANEAGEGHAIPVLDGVPLNISEDMPAGWTVAAAMKVG